MASNKGVQNNIDSKQPKELVTKLNTAVNGLGECD
jgi:hypothetical protein